MTEASTNAALEIAAHMHPPHTFRRIPLLPHQMLSRITAQRDLFVLAHVGVPRIDAGAWTLRVDGLVREARNFTIDDIKRLPKVEIESFHQCAGYPQNPTIATRRAGNVAWGGADLRALLDEIGVLPNARFLWSYGLDRGEYEGVVAAPYFKDCPLERIEGGDVLLVYEINGEPLDPEHGFPYAYSFQDFTVPIPSSGCRGYIWPIIARTVLSRPGSTMIRARTGHGRSGESRRNR